MRLGTTSMSSQMGPGAGRARALIGQMVGRCLQLVGLEGDPLAEGKGSICS
jgi:hypothetical protein